MKRIRIHVVGLAGILLSWSANGAEPASVDRVACGIEDVFGGFRNPPAEARPFVRWWWNGDQVEEKELVRELELLHQAGIGGVEINPIAKPKGPKSSAPVLTWRSPAWDRMVHIACKAAHERGMTVDLIAGSGWPFGGEFLKPDEQIMRMSVVRAPVEGPFDYHASLKEVFAAGPPDAYADKGERGEAFCNPKLEFLILLPQEAASMDQVQMLDLPRGDAVDIKVPSGPHVVAYGIRERGYYKVKHGAPGAMGPVMDHMNREATLSCLNRRKGMEETLGEALSAYVCAIFCDSIETKAADWTPGILQTFQERKGYDITPYLPMVLARTTIGVPAALKDQAMRARYDWNEHVVHTFLRNFTETYGGFCHDNHLLSRYQAYGGPYYMGLAEGYMIPDIPEANNWTYSGRDGNPYNNDGYVDYHGSMLWSKYAAAGAHLRGEKVVSTEAMTNTEKVFHSTLATIKQSDDMNFIGGITHSVLHGFNYSPPDVPFPGWIQYGTYFSENNTWWPYFKRWTDYNARLSHVFQSTAPVSEIALIGPAPDVWSTDGLERDAFNGTPKYLHTLWGAIAQLGGTCDYLHGTAFQMAKTADGTLQIGPMAYKVLMVVEMEGMEPQTAEAIQKFAAAGGRVIYVKSPPSHAPGLANAKENDRRVAAAVQATLQAGANVVQPPAGKWKEPPSGELREWVLHALSKVDYAWPLRVGEPCDGLYQTRCQAKDADLFFLTNTYRSKSTATRVSYNLGDRGLWRWDPETGMRAPYDLPYDATGFQINLRPLESILLVTGEKKAVPAAPGTVAKAFGIDGPWKVTFQPARSDQAFAMDMAHLQGLSASMDPRLDTFSGTAIYECGFDLKDVPYTHIELGRDNDFISEIWLNQKPVGVNWYGSKRFDVRPLLQKGRNELRIRYTTTLYNMMRGGKKPGKQGEAFQPSGLLGPVQLLQLK